MHSCCFIHFLLYLQIIFTILISNIISTSFSHLFTSKSTTQLKDFPLFYHFQNIKEIILVIINFITQFINCESCIISGLFTTKQMNKPKRSFHKTKALWQKPTNKVFPRNLLMVLLTESVLNPVKFQAMPDFFFFFLNPRVYGLSLKVKVIWRFRAFQTRFS